jgi:transcriptional regulator with XRE-family HTH domain
MVRKTSKNQAKNLSQLSQKIRQARLDANLSQDELAQAIGVSDKSVSAYEQGRATPPFQKLQDIAQKTNHSLTYFTEEKMDQTALKNKLQSIEKELAEIKKLLKNSI